jgi:hypothetical protein
MGEQTTAQQTWQNLQDYFTEKWLVQRYYLQATAKHSWFKDAALAAQELAAAGEEGETTARMFALLQEQHKAQLKSMAAANKQAMDPMFVLMNALITGQGKAADQVTARIPNSNTGHPAPGITRRKMCKLQKSCFLQARNLLQARVQCKQALLRMKMVQD